MEPVGPLAWPEVGCKTEPLEPQRNWTGATLTNRFLRVVCPHFVGFRPCSVLSALSSFLILFRWDISSNTAEGLSRWKISGSLETPPGMPQLWAKIQIWRRFAVSQDSALSRAQSPCEDFHKVWSEDLTFHLLSSQQISLNCELHMLTLLLWSDLKDYLSPMPNKHSAPIWAVAEVYYQNSCQSRLNSCQSRFSGVHFVLEKEFKEMLAIFFLTCRRASRCFNVFQSRVAHFCSCFVGVKMPLLIWVQRFDFPVLGLRPGGQFLEHLPYNAPTVRGVTHQSLSGLIDAFPLRTKWLLN